ncbi:phosphoribosyltransferase [Pseudomonas savastanoi]|uniref:phosphoribosyltransferase n=1 Tax=Pseudomonas savastanoi TaxID=29438 RepID=UPI0017815A85|nr:phosphoribosyltransferase [Pseudomonas savastanoi]QOI07936.1 phosphoribosyltransferase [Pseudomonas savastanoi]
MNSTRVAWGDFPPVIRNGLSMLSREPEYIAAKAGDWEAAVALVYRLMTVEMVESVRALTGDDPDARIVPIQAQESSGRNKIPLAVAEVLAHQLDIEVEHDICQIDRVFRTGASADHRLAFCPNFQGTVVPGRSYIVVDDTMTMGGTIAELRGYIMSNGGRVAGAAVMAAREGAVSLPVKQKMLDAIRQKHGEQVNEFWKQEFGHGLDKLTQHEAGHLRAASSFESIRDRIAAARDAARRPEDERLARPQGEEIQRLKVIGFSEYRAGQITRAESFFEKAQESFWVIGDQLPGLRVAIETQANFLGVDPKEALKNFRDDLQFSELASQVRLAVAESSLARAAEKRVLLTQRRLDREQSPREREAAVDSTPNQDLDHG